jgi:hypothetical protein
MRASDLGRWWWNKYQRGRPTGGLLRFGALHNADARAFSSEVDTGSREENASKQES